MTFGPVSGFFANAGALSLHDVLSGGWIRSAAEPEMTTLVTFGDSLSDTGAVFDLTARTLIAPIPLPGNDYANRFSDGVVQVEVTASLAGLTLDNYAVGGARALGSQTLSGYLDALPPEFILPVVDPADLNFEMNLSGQVARFAGSLGGSAPSEGTAAAFLIGANDLGPAAASADPLAAVVSIANATLAAAGQVVALGVDKVFLYTLPDATFFPTGAFLTPQEAALAELGIQTLNQVLRVGGATLGQATGADVRIIEFGAMANAIADDPVTFGLTAPFAAPVYLGTGRPTFDPSLSPFPFYPENPLVADRPLDQVGFIDFVHPTAATHGVLGAFVAASFSSDLQILGDTAGRAFGTFGKDLVLAGAGDDRILLRSGDDIALGGHGNDRMFAGSGDDIVSGGSGSDLLLGQFGHDVLAGGAGNDRLFGSFGDDLIIDGMGSDRAHGGAGRDTFLFVEAPVLGLAAQGDMDVFFGGSGQDTVYLALTEDTRRVVEDQIAQGGFNQRFDAIGLSMVGIENLVFLDDPDDLADLNLAARVDEAALWGFV